MLGRQLKQKMGDLGVGNECMMEVIGAEVWEMVGGMGVCGVGLGEYKEGKGAGCAVLILIFEWILVNEILSAHSCNEGCPIVNS